MSLVLRVLSFLLVLLATSAALADEVTTLVARLGEEDFRVRAKAALSLGKTKDDRALQPLLRALDDTSPAVRAAAAAALQVLGDERAIPTLEKRKDDKSTAVRAQVRSSIAALKRKAERRNEKPDLLVKIGDVSAAEADSERLKLRFERESRRKLEGLPGVMVLEDSEDPGEASKERQVPVVMVTARLQKANAAREGSSVVYSARVQYVVHTMPGKAIVGLVSGEASARASLEESRDAKKVAELRDEVLAAAVESAVRRAPAALKAAAQ